jgi:hypothetical protein
VEEVTTAIEKMEAGGTLEFETNAQQSKLAEECADHLVEVVGVVFGQSGAQLD